MRRSLVIAALVAVFLMSPAWGQMRGGRSSVRTGRWGFGPRGPVVINRGWGLGTGPGFNGFFRPSFFPHRFRHSQFFFGFGAPWPRFAWSPVWAGGVYSYPAVAGYYPATATSYYPDTYYSNSYYRDNYYEQNRELTRELDRLTDEVERLREEQENQAATAAGSPARMQSKTEPQRSTVLVFRDKRTEEVQNYAVIGQTLWIFDEQKAKKIPLADLDLPATAKLNNERGVDFSLPK